VEFGLNGFYMIGRKNQKILEDAFEAFIGALYLDFGDEGFNVAGQFIIHIIEDNIDFSELIVSNNNYKDTLLKYFQHNFSTLPRFVEISVDNKGNNKMYTIGIKNKEGLLIATGKGNTKKQGENEAALNALKYFGQT
jgi:ribonuclease-3